MKPRAFVVMPFSVKEAQAFKPAADGKPEQRAVNVNFDEVYDALLAPALTRAGCVPFRADRAENAGDIRTDMYFELVTADVIVADISILNANVFYELGVRHGVAPRGVLMVHGGWSQLPFDVAPDRTFGYNGQLFVHPPGERDDSWQQKLDAAVVRLADTLRAALETDAQSIGSPVYKELAGLKPADWSEITPARAKYFGDMFEDLKGRVEVARTNNLPGDILTLADDAPTRFYRARLLWEAARALISLQRFAAARPVLEELIQLDPAHANAQSQLGLVLARLGHTHDAKVHMTNVAARFAGDPEAHGILGRIYKDLWRLQWDTGDDLAERQRQAVYASSYAAEAVRSYNAAQRKNYNSYYNGINVVTLAALLEHLKAATGEETVDYGIDDLADMRALLRLVTADARDCATDEGRHHDAVWAAATLGELELVAGDATRATNLYRQAANALGVTPFHLDSMLAQVRLFERLGFRPEATAAVAEVLTQKLAKLSLPVAPVVSAAVPAYRFRRVFGFSGHMIDRAERPAARFPAGKEAAVRAALAAQLNEWQIAAGDLALCGAANGGDTLFAELCLERGAEVWLMLALPENEFLNRSVRSDATGNWENRYYRLRDAPGVKVFVQSERLKSPPRGTDVFARNNLWLLNTARSEAEAKNLYALLVWDEQPTGDGPGGTSDFAARVRDLGGHLAPIINPTKL